jgi:hypothetical protein
MTISHYNRRNFLSSMAILSIGTSFGPGIKHFSPSDPSNDLEKRWKAFWKKSGGQVFHSLTDLNSNSNNKGIKGHRYKYGEIIYFPKENILAQPTWIFWKNNLTKPADVIVTLFENNYSFKKISCLNRYEMDACYRLSKEPDSEELLLSSVSDRKTIAGSSTGIKTKTSIKKNSQIQIITSYRGRLLIYEDKLIHHT